MADAILPLSPAAPGGQIEDVEQLNVAPPAPPPPLPGEISIVRQRIEIVGRLYNQIAAVLDIDPPLNEFGLVVRVAGHVLSTVPATSNAALSSVPSSAVSVLLLASNPLRRQAVIVNESTAVLCVSFSAVASLIAYTYLLLPGSTLELPQPIFTGDISGIWVFVSGNARITELTI